LKMNAQKIFFGKVKEDRGSYFVEYSPPLDSYRFATLNLVILDAADKSKIAHAMETELHRWLARYQIPLMVSAFDATDSLIHLAPIKECDSLMGFVPKGQKTIQSAWRLLENEELPDEALNRDYLRKVYFDVPFKTSADVERDVKKHRQMVLIIKWIDNLWTIAIPLAILLLPEFSSRIAAVFLVYGLLKILADVLKKAGVSKKSRRQVEKEKEELDMRHHHYHCERNPQAFLRLKIENFEREAKERTRKEADALKQKS